MQIALDQSRCEPNPGGRSRRSLTLRREAAGHSNYLQAVPFTENDVGIALVVLFHEPLKPMPP